MKTKRNYSGYEGVHQLEEGDAILTAQGHVKEMLSTSVADGGETYSIENLAWGHGFLANGILVGSAKVRSPYAMD